MVIINREIDMNFKNLLPLQNAYGLLPVLNILHYIVVSVMD